MANEAELRAALEYYADSARWTMNSAGVTPAMDDRGHRARAALARPAPDQDAEARAREVLAQTMEKFGGVAKLSCAADIRNDVGGEYWEVPLRAMLAFAAERVAEVRDRDFKAGWDAGFLEGNMEGMPNHKAKTVHQSLAEYATAIRAGISGEGE